MKAEKEPTTYNALWLAMLGLLLGVPLVIIATLIAISANQLPFTLDSVIQVQTSEPLLWLIDILPIALAIFLGILGGRLDDRAVREWRLNRTIQMKDGEIARLSGEIQNLNSEVTTQEQARLQLDATTGRGKREWEATFDTIDDMILITDVSGTVLRCNRATSHAFRTGFEYLIGKPIESLFFGEGVETGFPASGQKTEMKFPRLDGWYEVSSTPILVEEGRAATIYVIGNTTQHKQAELDLSRQKEYYETLFRNSPFAIATLSLDQRVVDCNPAFEALFGYTQAEAIGRDLDSLVAAPEEIDQARSLTEAVRRGEHVHRVAQRQRKDGSPVTVEAFGLPVVLWGKQIGVLALYHDVSELVPAKTEPPSAAAAAATAAWVEAITHPEPEPLEETTPEAAFLPEPEPEPVTPPEPEPEAAIPPEPEPTPGATPPAKPRRRLIPVEDIEGIGPVYAARLGELGIKTTEDLLNAGATRKGREDLVAQTELSPKLILRWVNLADLMRVPGVGEEYSELLEAAGVDTVKELRGRNPENLYQAMLAVNEEKKLVRRTPHLREVEAWVQEAKELEPIMKY